MATTLPLASCPKWDNVAGGVERESYKFPLWSHRLGKADVSVLVEVCVYLAHITWASVNTASSTLPHISCFYLITWEGFCYWSITGIFYRTDLSCIGLIYFPLLVQICEYFQNVMLYTTYNSLVLLSIIVPTSFPMYLTPSLTKYNCTVPVHALWHECIS